MIIKYGNTDITHLILEYKRKGSIDDTDAFLFGNTPSCQIDLKIDNSDKLLQTLTGNIYEYDDSGKLKGTYFIYEAPEKWTSIVKLSCFDFMLYTNVSYDSKLSYPTTIRFQLDEISTITGLKIDYSMLPEHVINQEVNWWDNTISCRNYLGWIAELVGTNVFVSPEGNLFFKEIGTDATYSTQDIDDIECGDAFTISRVCFDNGLLKLVQGDDTGNTLYVSGNNPYVDTEHDPTPYIYNKYKGFVYRSVEKMKAGGIDDITLFDVIEYQSNKYLCLNYTSTYKGGTYQIQDIKGALATKNAEKSTVKFDDMIRVRKLEVLVDNNKQTLDLVAKDIEGANEKLSNISQTVNSITQSVSETTQKVETIENTKRYRLEVSSSKGTAFRNGDIDTALSVKIYSWDEDITSVISDTSVVWSRISADAAGDNLWSKHGKSITITGTDFTDSATFTAAWNGIEQVISLVNVRDGESGIPGNDGKDGRTTYFHIRYSAYPHPLDDQMTTTPDKYIGTYVDYLPEDSTIAERYTWSQLMGDDGVPGLNGENGKTSYIHMRYSNDGGKTFTGNNGKSPGDFLGQYTDFIQKDSENTSLYTWTRVKGESGKDATVVALESTRGSMFKNSAISTTLLAVVYHGDQQINDLESLKDAIAPSAQLQWSWKEFDEKEFTIIPSDDPRIGSEGFALNVNPGEVNVQAIFKCEVVY